MAVIVQTEDIVSDANSYVSLADANSYLQSRDYPTVLTEGQLLRAADYINNFGDRFRGVKATNELSEMQWPRCCFFLSGTYLSSNVIPPLIISAQVITANEIANERNPSDPISSPRIKRRRVENIEIEYQPDEGAEDSGGFDFRAVMNILRPVLNAGRYYLRR